MARDNDLGMGQGLGTRIASTACVAFLFAPIPILIYYSFNAGNQVTHWEGFSLKWYRVAFADRAVWLGVRNSLIIATANTIISMVLGTAAAMVLAKYTFRGRLLFQNLIYVPIILPEIIFGLSILALFVFLRMPLGFVTVTCAHATFSLSFVALIVLAKLHQFDTRLEEASLDLGANRLQTFLKVTLPVIAPGIVSGAIFAFTLSLDDFVTTLFTAGAQATTLPLRIYSLVRYGATPELNAVSTLLILMTLSALWAGYQLQKRTVSRRMLFGLAGAAALLVGSAMAVAIAKSDDEKTLNLCNYAGYMDDGVIEDFEKETGIRVNLTFMNSNEQLLNQLCIGACDFDLIMPSDYMVEIMVKLNLLARIDHERVPNIVNIDERFRRMVFEPTGEYYVPYAFGCSGITYNKELVGEPVDSWHALLDERYKGRILMFDDPRGCFWFAFKILGYSLEDKDSDHLKQALELLREQKPLLLRYDSNTIQELLVSHEAVIAQHWSGGGLRTSLDHPEIAFALPREGVPMFVDNLCIPHNARHKENAGKFLDYLLRPEVAARNMSTILYPMPNPKARNLLPEKLRTAMAPMYDLMSGNYDMVLDLGEFNQALDRAWTELRGKR